MITFASAAEAHRFIGFLITATGAEVPGIHIFYDAVKRFNRGLYDAEWKVRDAAWHVARRYRGEYYAWRAAEKLRGGM